MWLRYFCNVPKTVTMQRVLIALMVICRFPCDPQQYPMPLQGTWF